jgi:hypothetical protein
MKRKKHLGTRKLVHYINDKIDTDVSDRTLRNVSKGAGFKFNFPVKKPLLTERHKKNRLKFAKDHKNTNWDTHIFTDEKTFTLGTGKMKERYVEGYRRVANSVKHPKKLHVWWGISKKYKIKPYCFTDNFEKGLYPEILSERLPTSDPIG